MPSRLLRDDSVTSNYTPRRPYILLLFGDHQPHTFVGSGGSVLSPYSYEHLRKRPNDRTFYQIRGSIKSPFPSRKLALPINVLPTVVSAFISETPDSWYMADNLAVLRECGSSVAEST